MYSENLETTARFICAVILAGLRRLNSNKNDLFSTLLDCKEGAAKKENLNRVMRLD